MPTDWFRRVGSSLRVRNYRLYFLGQSVSVAGTWMQTLALALLVLRLTGSGTDLGLVTAARLLPFVLAGPLGGVIADRRDKRGLLYFTQTCSALTAVVFTVLIAVHAISVPLVILLSLLSGCLTVLDNPARQSLIAELVPREHLANAVTLNSVSVNVARVLGSALGGTLVALVGLGACFALNAASFAAVLVSLFLMRRSEMYPSPRLARSRGQVRAGLSYATRTPALAVPLLLVAVTGTLAYEFPVTLPLVARGAFHGDAAAYGAMAAFMGVGAVVGGLSAAGRKRRLGGRALAFAAIGWGAAILAAAAAPVLWLELAFLVLVGYGAVTFNAQAKSSLQLASDPSMRGRVMALWSMAWSGSTAVGGPLVGFVAQELGSRWSLVLGGAPTLLLGLGALRALRRIELGGATSSAGP
jgi:MFS family permease